MPDVRGGLRAIKQIALHIGATHRRKQPPLVLCFNTLGSRRHAEIPGKRDDRLDNRHGVIFLVQTRDERPVDLDLVERQLPQIAQRRVPGAKVVKRDGNAERSQLSENHRYLFAIAEQCPFRDFEFEP